MPWISTRVGRKRGRLLSFGWVSASPIGTDEVVGPGLVIGKQQHDFRFLGSLHPDADRSCEKKRGGEQRAHRGTGLVVGQNSSFALGCGGRAGERPIVLLLRA